VGLNSGQTLVFWRNVLVPNGKRTIWNYRLVVGKRWRRRGCITVAALFVASLGAWALICVIGAVTECASTRGRATKEAGIHVLYRSSQLSRRASSSSAAVVAVMKR
jgi:hypothetical protein